MKDIYVNDDYPKYTRNLKLNSKKNNPIKKMLQSFNRDITKNIQMTNKYMKRSSTSEKWKLIQQVRYPTHLSEWPKSGTMATPKADKNVEQQDLSFITGGNEKWHSYFCKTDWQFLTKPKSSYCMIQWSYSFIFTQRNWKVMSTKSHTLTLQKLYIHHCQNWEANQDVLQQVNKYKKKK